MKLNANDIIEKYDYIDVLKIMDGYRVHNSVCGLILKVDKFTALVLSLINGCCTYNELKLRIEKSLGEDYLYENDIINIIISLYHLQYLNIKFSKKKPTILLINPCYRYPNSVYKELTITPPLGILSIGALLFEKGYDVHLLDMLVEDIRPEDLSKWIKKIKPDIVGISMNFTSTANICMEIARILKSLLVKTIFVGGNHATFTYEKILEDKNVDYVIRFQGEETVLELIETLKHKDKSMLTECKGIAYRNHDKIVVTDRRQIPQNLNNMPLPKWMLLPMSKYPKDLRWSLITSQGCPCACTFCSTSAFNNGKKVIFMSVPEIIKRIKGIINLQYEDTTLSISFSDDAFTYNRERVIELCRRILKENLKFIWACSTRVDLIDEELIDIMYKAGCRNILFGIESCSNKVLKTIGKRINIEQAKRSIEIVKRRGIKVKEMFILGLPYESNETLNLIEDFFKETKPDEIRFGLLAVYPGTPLWNHSEKFGINILSKNWSDYEMLRPISNNTILSAEELYIKYIEFTEKYENTTKKNEIKII
ncbi:B12-binding domain-containing radical SAM protein [Clostridium felsineum]|uniref:B12-binding domain-containing radical SAM protein n=1 Tax=Clostridium felsineum TaxID=36839 RepID=UPI00098BED4D|nr:radical SAM protein [Clostridium felsineum]URZ14076.1 hypothetical protein CLFE_000510 [Clostridium felsineum DSM 794]